MGGETILEPSQFFLGSILSGDFVKNLLNLFFLYYCLFFQHVSNLRKTPEEWSGVYPKELLACNMNNVQRKSMHSVMTIPQHTASCGALRVLRVSNNTD